MENKENATKETNGLMNTVKMAFKANVSRWRVRTSNEYKEEDLARMMDDIFRSEGLMVRESGKFYTNTPYQSMSETYKAFESAVNKLRNEKWFEKYYKDKGICMNYYPILGDETLVYPYFRSAFLNIYRGEIFSYDVDDYTNLHATICVNWRKDCDKEKLSKVREDFEKSMINAGFQIYDGVGDNEHWTVFTEPCIYVDDCFNGAPGSGFILPEYDDEIISDERKEEWYREFIATFRYKAEAVVSEYLLDDDFLDCVSTVEKLAEHDYYLKSCFDWLTPEELVGVLEKHPHIKEELKKYDQEFDIDLDDEEGDAEE